MRGVRPHPLVALVAATVLVGAVPPDTGSGTGSAPMEETAAAAANTATVFYYTKTKNWPTTYLHYAPDGGSWTTVPGTQMESACTDWVKKTVDLGDAAGLQATFNNGSGTWDNNGGSNYALGTGTVTVKDGVIAHSDPCADTGTGTGNQATVYSGGTDAWAENMALMWTFRGIPTLYYGSEIEFQKGQKIDCGPTCALATTGRAYYGDHLAGTVTATDFGTVGSASGEVATTLAQPLVKHLQRLNQIRRAVPALQMGQYSTDGISGQMAFKRRYTSGSTDSFALVTVTGDATCTGIPNGTYTDAVTGDVRTVSNGTLTVAAPGKGNLRVYVLGGPGKIGTAGPYLK